MSEGQPLYADEVYDGHGWRRTECIRFVKRKIQVEALDYTAVYQNVRILQQLWVNPRLPDGENKQWRDVPCVEEE